MGVVSFLPLYMQLGLGAKPSESGVAMLPLMLGMIISSVISGRMVSRTGHFKPVLLTGLCILVLGLFLLVQSEPGRPLWDVSWRVFIMGVGLGPTQSLFNLAIQNSVKPQDIGVATASSQFFRQVGSTMGVAIFGTLLTTNLASAAKKISGSLAFKLEDLERLAATRAVGSAGPSAVDQTVQRILSMAIHNMFAAGIVVLIVAFLLSLTIPGVRLAGRGPQLEGE
jgi:MFS family permease